ncbi:MAG: DUF4360 domain-containing protein [Bdellovibrio sp.]|nr:DUF4360 domain-containing protein [Bdellovibrio sp.]
MKAFLTLATTLILALSAEAQISLGQPSYGGSGCPSGSASVSLTPDGQTMSVLFDSFKAEAGNTTARRIDRASCNLRVPINVPQGYSVALISVDYRGFNAVPGQGAYTQFDAEYFYAGSRGPRFSKRFVGPTSDEYLINNKLIATSMVWSPCGQQVIFGINASATAMANSQMQQTMMIVDSADIAAGMLYQFSWRRCQ